MLPPYALHGDDGNGNFYYGNWNPPATGAYTLTATPYSGAKATGTVGIPLTINFTFTNQNSTISSAQLNAQKVKNLDASQLVVYPNPFTTKANIDIILPEPGEFSLILYDSKGAFVKEVSRMYTGANVKNSIEINQHSLTPGLYFLKLISNNGAKVTKLMFRL